MLSPEARDALDELVRRDDPSILGLVLSGSAARGMATERSDVDVFVVRAAQGEERPRKSAAIDEIPDAIVDLEDVSPYGTPGWWGRWAYAYAEVLRDDAGGRITAAVRRLALVDSAEQRAILIDHDRLDGSVNYAYRSLKSDRDGRAFESRLDAVESVPWLLDVVFTLAGRVRPYNKYLAWELREHPLAVPEWSAEALLPELERILAGDPAALRRTFAVVDREVRAWDATHATTHDITIGGDLIDAWGTELDLFTIR
ncbi:nucleotidyltransferase domain-containing protein [Nocardioides sp. GXZ039]|uniref:nucleotidyltransferase domain-containing protein n=1 Tax=Nocardioides sp. GXZ039 TaxID=3136018 RepID=UPI0030F454C9